MSGHVEPQQAGLPGELADIGDVQELRPTGSAFEVLTVATKLGLTCFGGPIAHLGYFRTEYVEKRHWLDDRTYADLVALCQFLPGAASSKVGMSVGILRAGLLGGLAAWIGFTLPSAVALVLAAFAINDIGPAAADWLQGLKLVAVAVVAQAVWGMARTLTPDRLRASIAIGGAAMTFVLPATLAQLGVITISGLIGWRFLVGPTPQPGPRVHVPIPRWLAHVAWALLLGLLVVLPLARALTHVQAIALLDSFYRSGALVFGGGHVVLPLLQAEVVQPGWVSNEEFLTGYGLAQAVPGPLFTFSAFLGTVMGPSPNGVVGAAIALTGIFLPSMLLTIGALPYWTTLRARSDAQATLRGVNAGVVGLLLAALYDPVWTSAVHRPSDFALALAAFGLLTVWRVPPWIVVLTTTLTAGLLAHAIGTRI